MTLDLDNLARLEAAASPAPWGTEYDGMHVDEMVYVQRDDNNSEVCSTYNRHPTEHGHEESQANALFIAAARNALPALLADHARLEAERDEAVREMTECIDALLTGPVSAQVIARCDLRLAQGFDGAARLHAELTAERDAHHATCDALARERAENTRDAIASQERIADEQDANRELRRDIERIREDAAVDRLAAARAIREMGEMEVAHRTVEAERDAMRATLAHIAERGTEHDRLVAEVADLRGSVESYMAMLDDANVDRSAALVRAERIEAESDAEVARLRGLLAIPHEPEPTYRVLKSGAERVTFLLCGEDVDITAERALSLGSALIRAAIRKEAAGE